VLRLLLCWLRSADDQTIEGGAEQTDIMSIGPIHDQCQWNPGCIRQETAFGSLFAAIGGVGSGRGVTDQGPWSALHRLLATRL
jgi:hypothetical protein